jgi:superfamily II DNA/RNA helicase
VRTPSSDPKAKRAALRALVGREDVRNGIVFCNRKSEVDVVAKSLKRHGFDAAPIHGDLDQSLRMKTLADFRSGALKILVASDVAARGLDIPDVSHVFNYDVAHHADDYVHRIGRTGRAGRKGQTFMIVTPADDRALDKVLKLIKMAPEELTLDGVDLGGGRPPRAAEKAERPARGRRSQAAEEAVETAADAGPADEVAASPEPKAEGEPRRRSRGRRGAKAAPEAAAAPALEAPVAEAAPAEPEPARERQRQEPQLRQSDRRGGGRKAEPERTHARPFGEAEIPAFLRRPVPLKS